MIITHRVEKIEKSNDGSLLFHTKGIANNIEDPIVSGNQIIGKVIHKFYTLSVIGGITTSPFKIFFFLTVPIAILISIEIIKTLRNKDEDEEEIEYEETTFTSETHTESYEESNSESYEESSEEYYHESE